jgi:hypothetical protein
LREKYVPVLCAEGGEEDTEDNETAAKTEDGEEVASVEGAAGEGAEREEEKDLD